MLYSDGKWSLHRNQDFTDDTGDVNDHDHDDEDEDDAGDDDDDDAMTQRKKPDMMPEYHVCSH